MRKTSNYITFSPAMVRSTRDNLKLFTRRPVEGGFDPNPYPIATVKRYEDTKYLGTQGYFSEEGSTEQWGIKFPYGSVGDLLHVKEAWVNLQDEGIPSDEPIYHFRADGETVTYLQNGKSVTITPKWKPSSTMPASISRFTLEITSVDIQRLQSITEEDAKAEGVVYSAEPGCTYGNGYVAQFRKVWDGLYGKNSWNQNLWVWVIGFKVVPSERNI